jgi:nitrogen regulatory protein PII
MEPHMRLVTVILRPEILTAVQKALGEIGIEQVTYTNAWGTGHERSQVQLYRGATCEVRLPRIKMEIVVEDDCVDAVIDAVTSRAKTGQVGDGIVLVQPIETFVRIRTGARRGATERRPEPAHVPANRLTALATVR